MLAVWHKMPFSRLYVFIRPSLRLSLYRLIAVFNILRQIDYLPFLERSICKLFIEIYIYNAFFVVLSVRVLQFSLLDSADSTSANILPLTRKLLAPNFFHKMFYEWLSIFSAIASYMSTVKHHCIWFYHF